MAEAAGERALTCRKEYLTVISIGRIIDNKLIIRRFRRLEVIKPVMMTHYMMLQRNLIYTAITRGRKLVVVVGTKKALAIGVKNNKTEKRYSLLKHRLM